MNAFPLVITKTGILALLFFLLVHFYGSEKGWYNTKDWFDILTHFLGGLTLSLFLPVFHTAFILMVLWEIVETVLHKPGNQKFKESLTNKIRDVAAGVAGYAIGLGIIF